MNGDDLFSTEQRRCNHSLLKYVNLGREVNSKDTWPGNGLVFILALAGVTERVVVLHGGTELASLNSNLQFINCGLGRIGYTIELMVNGDTDCHCKRVLVKQVSSDGLRP